MLDEDRPRISPAACPPSEGSADLPQSLLDPHPRAPTPSFMEVISWSRGAKEVDGLVSNWGKGEESRGGMRFGL